MPDSDANLLHGRPDLTVPTKLAFGAGNVVENVQMVLFYALGMVYYYQTVGLDAGLCGLATTIALVWDGISDPLVGMWSDCHCSKRFGRRHKFMAIAIIPVSVSLLLFFSAKKEWSQMFLFGWMTFWLLALRTSNSFFSVPHLALGADLATDYSQRTQIMSYNAAFGYMIGPTIIFVGMFFMLSRQTEEYPDGMQNPENYPLFILISSGTMLVGGVASIIGTFHFIPHLPQPEEGMESDAAADCCCEVPNVTPLRLFLAFLWELYDAFHNRSFVCLTVAYLVLSFGAGIGETTSVLGSMFYWEFKPKQIALFPLMYPFAALLAPQLVRLLSRRQEKRTLTMGLMSLSCLNQLWPILFVWLGIMRRSPDMLPILLANYFLSATIVVSSNIMVMSMMSDIAEEQFLLTGRRREAVLFSARTLCSKAASALAHMVAGFVLDFIEMPPNAKIEDMDDGLRYRLSYLLGPTGSIFSLISIFCLIGYKINRQRADEVKRLLSRKATDDEFDDSSSTLYSTSSTIDPNRVGNDEDQPLKPKRATTYDRAKMGGLGLDFGTASGQPRPKSMVASQARGKMLRHSVRGSVSQRASVMLEGSLRYSIVLPAELAESSFSEFTP